jgi:hypothetical protein
MTFQSIKYYEGRGTLSLAEFASRWKLTLTKVLIRVRRGTEDAIRGEKGFIYEHSGKLAYDVWDHSNDGLYHINPVWFNPKGYPGEAASIRTQEILINKLGIYPRAVPLVDLANYYRERDADDARLWKAEQQRAASAQPEGSGGSVGT